MHPASTSSLEYQVVFNDGLHPIPSVRVCEIDHGKFDAQTIDKVWITVLVLDEVAIITAFLELILSNAFNITRILNIRVDIDEGFDAVHGPL